MRVSVELRPTEKAVVLVSVVLFVLLAADVIAGGLVTDLDEQIRNAIDPAADPPAYTLVPTGLGEPGVGGVVLAISALVCAHLSERVWPVLLALGNIAAIAVLVIGVKVAIGRVGPGLAENPAGYPGYFPSGHTATSAVCFGTALFIVLRTRHVLQGREPWVSLLAGLGCGVITGVGAVLGDSHWTSDALAALTVSAVVLTVGFAACRGYVDR